MKNMDVEQRLLNELSGDELWNHTQALSRWQRLSGTADEREAADYIARTLESCGASVAVHRFDSLLGYPGPASLRVVHPEDREIQCITHGFGGRTPPGGVEAEIAYVGAGNADDYQGRDLAGHIVVAEGLPMGFKAKLAEEAGARGEIFIQDERLHEICLSPVWGTPTPSSAERLPVNPCLSIRREDGLRLRGLLEAGPVRVRLTAEPVLEWRETPLVEGEVRGSIEPERYVMLSAHICGWYYGATDNATSDSAILEIARVLAKHRSQLRRSLRVFFWPGHSQGRFSGSTWYADNFWEEIYQSCVLHINVETLGARGADLYHVPCMAETADLALDIVREAVGAEPEVSRVGRAADQSFWGIGIPSMFTSVTQAPPELMTNVGGGLFQTPGAPARQPRGGMPWWWHTAEDTLDKVDRGALLENARIYLLAAFRACHAPILPLNYVKTAEQWLNMLTNLQDRAGDAFDLSSLADKARQLQEKVTQLDGIMGQVRSALAGAEKVDEVAIAEIDHCLLRLGRSLIPAFYTVSGPYDQDPATPLPLLPGLQGVRHLAELAPESDDCRFLITELLRQRNRAAHALTQAIDAVNETLQKMG
ncbi:MAG: M28 family peptidase [Dehalococcoidia bacterium]